MSTETLVTCPTCHTTGFTARGLKAHRCKGVNRNPSAAPGGDAVTPAPSDAKLQPAAAAPGSPTDVSPQLSTRLDRLKLWHAGAKSSAARLKLFVFLAGAEITALKDCLGVQERKSGEIVLPDGDEVPWKRFICDQIGMTFRSVRNYEIAYFTIAQQLPELAQRILSSVDIRLESQDQQPLALQLKFDEQLQKIRPADLESFRQATDPWNLSDLYKREIKPAQVKDLTEKARQKAELQDENKQLEFWFGALAQQIKRKDYLRLPRNHREMLLDELELAVRELKASLRSSKQ